MGLWAGLGEAASQMVEVPLAEHAVLKEGQLSEEHLRHLSQRRGFVRIRGRVLLQQGEGEPTEGQTQQSIRLQLFRSAVGASCNREG